MTPARERVGGGNTMAYSDSGDQAPVAPIFSLATRRDRFLAGFIAAGFLVAFLIAVPFARVPLVKTPAFIPSYEAVLLFIDVLTSLLLFEQFARVRSVSLLVLGSGYLFDAAMIIPHALSFPGAFTLTGLLGAKEQTTAWLYIFWHGGFPLFVIAYVLLRRHEESAPQTHVRHPGRAVLLAVLGVALVTGALTLLTTAGHDLLPVVMRGADYSLLVSKGISPAVWGLTVVAMLVLWSRKQRALDLWLMLVMWIWLFDIALAAVIGSSRFDLGFYAGRVFGLVAASFLLIALLMQLAQSQARAAAAAISAEQKLARAARLRGQPELTPIGKERTEDFIRRQNIAHYRALLESGKIEEDQHRTIQKLLDEEDQTHKPN